MKNYPENYGVVNINDLDKPYSDKITEYFVRRKREKNDVFFVDRNSDKVVMVSFKPGSGGNFLVNCLCLSPDVKCSFVSIEEKLNYLTKKLSDIKFIWCDFSLNNVLVNDNEEDKFFFISLHPHQTDDIKKHINFWKKIKIIYFKNPNLFRYFRRCVWHKSWEVEKLILDFDTDDLIFDTNLKNFISFDDYFKMSEHKKIKIKSLFNDKKEINSLCTIKDKREYYIWDTNWFLDKDETINNIKLLYGSLGLNGFDRKAISLYYKLWIAKIIEVRQQS